VPSRNCFDPTPPSRPPCLFKTRDHTTFPERRAPPGCHLEVDNIVLEGGGGRGEDAGPPPGSPSAHGGVSFRVAGNTPTPLLTPQRRPAVDREAESAILWHRQPGTGAQDRPRYLNPPSATRQSPFTRSFVKILQIWDFLTLQCSVLLSTPAIPPSMFSSVYPVTERTPPNEFRSNCFRRLAILL